MGRRSTPTEDRAEKIKAIQADLESKIESLRTSNDWKAALDVAAKFHKYSANNVFLLLLQAEARGIEINRVAGFNAWKALGRNVKRGERGLQILAPAKYKVDDPKHPGEKKWIIKGFTVAHVFDISQTEGDEIPDVKPALLTEGGEQAVLDQIAALIYAEGFEFSLGETPGSSLGYTEFEERKVVVKDSVSLTQQIKTAVHEYAHVLLHEPSKVDYHANRNRCEVEAESVAYVVLTHLGIAADDYSIPYVAGWSESKPETVKAAADTVFKTARQVIDALVPAEQAVAA